MASECKTSTAASSMCPARAKWRTNTKIIRKTIADTKNWAEGTAMSDEKLGRGRAVMDTRTIPVRQTGHELSIDTSQFTARDGGSHVEFDLPHVERMRQKSFRSLQDGCP